MWQAPGKPFAVHLHLGVVERLNAEIMRGFALVPKRGAEVGGVLYGSIATAEGTVVRIDDFEAIPTAYRRGPSFYPSQDEEEALGDAAQRERDGLRAVGYFRSHTRDGAMTLGTEDQDLIGRYFQDVSQVALIVRPFATKVGVAGFFVREDGAFPSETAMEFPFRRREMLGEEAPARRPMHERRPRNRERRIEQDAAAHPQFEMPERAAEYVQDYAPEPPLTWEEYAEPPKPRSPLVWIAGALMLLALGAAGGYVGATKNGAGPSSSLDAYALSLAAESTGNSLTVRWNREASAVQVAQRGALEIVDGDFSKSIPLDAAHLKEGTVIYQNSSPKVEFRLVVYLSGNATLSEMVGWTQ